MISWFLPGKGWGLEVVCDRSFVLVQTDLLFNLCGAVMMMNLLTASALVRIGLASSVATQEPEK